MSPRSRDAALAARVNGWMRLHHISGLLAALVLLTIFLNPVDQAQSAPQARAASDSDRAAQPSREWASVLDALTCGTGASGSQPFVASTRPECISPELVGKRHGKAS